MSGSGCIGAALLLFGLWSAVGAVVCIGQGGTSWIAVGVALAIQAAMLLIVAFVAMFWRPRDVPRPTRVTESGPATDRE